MVIMSFKLNKMSLAAIIVAAALILALIVLAVPGKAVAPSGSAPNTLADTNERRLAFLKQFGWEVRPEPEEVAEITIPCEFDQVYQKYNDLQKEQGFDLFKYRGKRVKRWTYVVTNYPGAEGVLVRANLLIYRNRIIGGDISSAEIDGFMHGFGDYSSG